jgi:hypothetical protein
VGVWSWGVWRICLGRVGTTCVRIFRLFLVRELYESRSDAGGWVRFRCGEFESRIAKHGVCMNCKFDQVRKCILCFCTSLGNSLSSIQ